MVPEPMQPDHRELCLCFHVPLGKLVKFHRLHAPRHPSDFARCHGAGTGCGWCVPFLERLFEQLAADGQPEIAMSPEEYRARRAEYFRTKKPDLPPPPDADAPLSLDLDDVLADVSDDLKLD